MCLRISYRFIEIFLGSVQVVFSSLFPRRSYTLFPVAFQTIPCNLAYLDDDETTRLPFSPHDYLFTVIFESKTSFIIYHFLIILFSFFFFFFGLV